MNDEFINKIKSMDLGELKSYYIATRNIGRVVKVLGVSTALLMVSFYSFVAVLIGAPLLYFFSQVDVTLDYVRDLIGIQILKSADK